MKNKNQLSFHSYIKGSVPPAPPRECGGVLSRKGKRKKARTLSAKLPMHLVLRSSSSVLLKKYALVEWNIERFADKFAVKIYRKATCSNHIHFLIKVNSRQDYTRFIRALTGALAKTLKIKWQPLPYTRLISWGPDFKNTRSYIVMNVLEALGGIPYQSRSGPRRVSWSSA